MYCIRISYLLQGFSAPFQFYLLLLTFNLLNDIITNAMELARSTSHGGLSLRRIFMFALAVLFTALLGTIVASPATHAADDASWSGSSIVYQGNKYLPTTDKEILKDVKLESASKVYVFVDPAQSNGNLSSSNGTSPPADRKIRLIYFAENVDSSTATEAKYKDLTYVGQGNYTDPSAVKTIAFTQTGAEGSTSCDVDTGLGWIICPVTTTLATAMDFIYKILAGFLEVRPVETGQDNALYRAWKFMQAFANVAFVIVFLIIIYSQLTGAGISSYGLKKLLPRLIIAALLVNLSYFISSIAIDISNVLGYSMQDIFISMRNSLVGTEGNSWDEAGITSWASLAEFGLSGGTLALAGGTAAFIAVADFGPEVVFLILPALVVALIAVLVALVVLAARQAIIIILVILSPLAFVAYLLPNTEKWFTKWRETFFTMLFIFPAFSVVFGGSQLAATAIIQTADSINLVILGMLVQVAPLFITPLLIKLGGGLLGRIAGLVNDPNKGIIDRTRKFTEERTQMAKARRLDTTPRNKAKKYQLLKRNAQFRDYRRRTREGYKSAHEAGADAGWANSPNYQKISHLEHFAHDYKEAGEADSTLHYEKSRVTDTHVRALDTRNRDLQEQINKAKSHAEFQWEQNNDPLILKNRLEARQMADTLASAKQNFEAQVKEMQAGTVNARFKHVPNIIATTALMREAVQENRINTSRISNAEAVQQEQFANLIKNDSIMAERAGGILEHGASKALAAANATIDHALEEAIKNIQTTSPIAAGKVDQLRDALDNAIANEDLASTVAYINKLAESQNAGVAELRKALREHEGNDLKGDMLKTVKQFINANSTINVAAEDVGSWSRDPNERSLVEVADDVKTWNDMTPTAFAGMKKSSQIEAMRKKDKNGNFAITKDHAEEILSNPQARGSLKPSVRKFIKQIATSKDPTFRPEGIYDDDAAASDDEDED